MTVFFCLLFFLYLILVGLLILGWNKSVAKYVGSDPLGEEPLLSIVIPVRNEQAGILHLLDDIRSQSYQNFEAIVVNDHSNDGTVESVLGFTQLDPRFRLVESCGHGKKHALTTGIGISTGEIIVTTDGDCRVKGDWLKTMQKCFQVPHTKMIFGGVKIEGRSFFSRVQSHEFLSLIGTGAATLSYGVPSMCNGANLAFRKTVFMEVEGYSSNFHIPSGDDEFLMRKIFRLYPGGIQFVSDANAVVSTSASNSFRQFVHQRIRWAGKWKHNISSHNAVLAIFIFGFQMSVLLTLIGIVTGWVNVVVGVALFFSKAVAEWIFLEKVAAFVDIRLRWSTLIFLQIFYPVYAVGIGLISTFGTFEWKGRKLKSLTIKHYQQIS